MGNKIITTLEISSTSVKSVTGYLLDGKPIILNAECVTLPVDAMKESMINDYGAVTKAVNQVLSQVKEKLKRQVTAVTLVVPSIGFEVYQHEQTTSIVSPISEIERIDIENVRSQVSKVRISEGQSIIDVIADKYIYDGGESVEPPLGKTSNELTIKAKLHAAPTVIVESYKRIVNQAGLKISRIVASVYAGAEVIRNLGKLPESYILVDLGAELINAALIGENRVYTSTFNRYGSNYMTAALADNLGITFDAAQHLKEKYGYDSRKTSYSTPIMSCNVGTKKVEITNSLYNDQMYGIASKFVIEINKAVKEIQAEDAYYETLPLIFVGGGNKLNGLLELIKDLIKPQSAIFVNSFALGARDGKFFNCVGALIVEGNAPVLRDDSVEDDLTDYEAYSRKIKLRRAGDNKEENDWEED